jgi:2-oxoglutarate ferredoxin oxidoreductase subunit gamma
MKQFEVIIGGVGGQGCVSGGNLLARAAAIYEGRESLMSCSYGSEARGTFTKSEVIISDTTIAFPYALNPNIVITLDPISYSRYVNAMKPCQTIIYDADFVTECPSITKQIGYSLSGTAVKAGNIASLNIVALGVLIKMTTIVLKESLEKVIEEQFCEKKRVLETNLKALALGIEIAEKSVVF